jgi:hypothetical protein
MEITIQKQVQPEVTYNLDFFNGQDFVANGAKGYVGFCKEEDVCIVYSLWPNNNSNLIGNNGNFQNNGQYAFRIKNEKLQYFWNGWLNFHESAQDEFQMNEADKILLGE